MKESRCNPMVADAIGQVDRKRLKIARRHLQEENKKYGATLEPIPRECWPHSSVECVGVWRSRHFLVQGFIEKSAVRLSINRTELQSNGDWKDGISWEELQACKDQAGYADRDAIEVYPATLDVVNVANIRHLWILNEPCPVAWRACP